MKRFTTILIYLFFAAFLSGCFGENPRDKLMFLDTPSNIQINENQLSWEEVLNTELYEIKIGDEVSETNKTFYDLIDLVEGKQYSISIRAYTENDSYQPSLWSEPINYTHHLEVVVIPILQTPSNLLYTEGTVSWSEVANVSYYEFSLGTSIITISEPFFELPETIPGQTYRISVRALGNLVDYRDSLWSDEFIIYIPTGDKELLETPTIISFDSGVITWDEIENSERYQIEVNNSVIIIDSTEAAIDWLVGEVAGRFTIRVKAQADLSGDFYDSLWSEPIVIEWDGNIVHTLDTDGVRLKSYFDSESRYEGRGDVLYPDYQATFDNVFDVYYFYVGAIDKIPLFSSNAYLYTSDGLSPVISNINTSGESISNTLKQALSSIKLVPYGGNSKVNLVNQLDSGEGMTKVVNEFNKYTNNDLIQYWPNTVNRVSPTLSRLFQYIDNNHQVRYSFNEDGFNPKHAYRETIYGTADVFVTIQYQRSNQTYNYKFEIVLNENQDLSFVTEQSNADGLFNYVSKNSLSFDINVAMDYISKNSGKNQLLWSADTLAAHAIGFDFGNGSISNPYIIGGIAKSPYEQFLLINSHLSKAFKLTVDIDLSVHNPVQFSSVIQGNFTGQLDGNGKTIKGLNKNLYITSLITNTGAGCKYRVGLFEHIGDSQNKVNTSSIVKNLTIENFNIVFNVYNGNSDDKYAFGILAGTSNGIIDNVIVKSSKLRVFRCTSMSGLLVGELFGEINNSKVTDSLLETNGDGGGMVGTNHGKVSACTLNNGTITYRFSEDTERSVGGIVGHLINSTYSSYPKAIVTQCSVSNTVFNNYHINSWKNWVGQVKYHSPKTGIIVGHAKSGYVISVGHENITKVLHEGEDGDCYFSVGWGWGGYMDSSVTVN